MSECERSECRVNKDARRQPREACDTHLRLDFSAGLQVPGTNRMVRKSSRVRPHRFDAVKDGARDLASVTAEYADRCLRKDAQNQPQCTEREKIGATHLGNDTRLRLFPPLLL